MIDFAAVESLVNDSARSIFGNATLVVIGGGSPARVDGILMDRRDEPDAIGTPRGVRTVTFEIQESLLGDMVAGAQVSVRSVNYAIARIERDKTGWVTLHLRGGVA